MHHLVRVSLFSMRSRHKRCATTRQRSQPASAGLEVAGLAETELVVQDW
jgi:hypothetical protein